MEPAAAFMVGVVVGTLFGFSVPIAEHMSRRRQPTVEQLDRLARMAMDDRKRAFRRMAIKNRYTAEEVDEMLAG